MFLKKNLEGLLLLGADYTIKFFLWIIRWTWKAIASSFNMMKQNTISIRSVPYAVCYVSTRPTVIMITVLHPGPGSTMDTSCLNGKEQKVMLLVGPCLSV